MIKKKRKAVKRKVVKKKTKKPFGGYAIISKIEKKHWNKYLVNLKFLQARWQKNFGNLLRQRDSVTNNEATNTRKAHYADCGRWLIE